MFTGRNLNDFIKNKPPLVIFTGCLILLTVTTFSFAFYIQHTKVEELSDSDFKENWIQLKKHFNQLRMYVQNNRSSKQNIGTSDFPDRHSVYVPVKITDLETLKKFTHIDGILTLEGWVSNCPKYLQKHDFMMISFTLPDMTKDHNKTHICVEIIGPKEYLPQFSEPACHLIQREKINVGILTSINLSVQSDVAKEDRLMIKVEFDPDANENFAVHLKPSDVTIIYMHLMWCSYSLAFIVMVMLLYAVFHKNKTIVDDI